MFLLAPTTTDDRAKVVCDAARGFVYYVSLKGTTGSGKLDPAEVDKVAHFKTMTDKRSTLVGIKDAGLRSVWVRLQTELSWDLVSSTI